MRSGHGVVLVVIHKPERSGRPSLVRGAGALRLGLPFGSSGTSGVLMVIHCAAAADCTSINVTKRPRSFMTAESIANDELRSHFSSMHAILTPVGSAVDVNPFVMIGRELRRRGHRVTLMSPDVFAAAVERAGVEFASTGSAEDFDRVTKNPDLWDPRRGGAVVFGEVLKHMRQSYVVLEQLYTPGDALLVGHSLSLFTRMFEETHAVAAATVHLAPTVLR